MEPEINNKRPFYINPYIFSEYEEAVNHPLPPDRFEDFFSPIDRHPSDIKKTRYDNDPFEREYIRDDEEERPNKFLQYSDEAVEQFGDLADDIAADMGIIPRMKRSRAVTPDYVESEAGLIATRSNVPAVSGVNTNLIASPDLPDTQPAVTPTVRFTPRPRSRAGRVQTDLSSWIQPTFTALPSFPAWGTAKQFLRDRGEADWRREAFLHHRRNYNRREKINRELQKKRDILYQERAANIERLRNLTPAERLQRSNRISKAQELKDMWMGFRYTKKPASEFDQYIADQKRIRAIYYRTLRLKFEKEFPQYSQDPDVKNVQFKTWCIQNGYTPYPSWIRPVIPEDIEILKSGKEVFPDIQLLDWNQFFQRQ